MSFQFQARPLDSVFRGPGHGTLSTQPRGSFYMRGSITLLFLQFSLSVLSDCDPVDCSMPGFSAHHQPQSLLRLVSIESVMPSNHLILCCPLLLLPSIFPSIRVFSKSQFFASGGQSIGASTSASVLAMNNQDWFPLGLNDLISLQPKGLLRVFSSTTVQKQQFLGTQLSLCPNSHIHPWLLEKP